MAPDDRQRHFDVIILGGGPGGTAAGMTLLKRDGVDVAVVEASNYTSPRIGESLTPGVRALLEYLGIWQRFRSEQSLESFGSQAAWGSDYLQALDYMFTPHGAGWCLDRVRFDRMLASAFRDRGGHLLTNTHFVGCARKSNGSWGVQVKDAEKTLRQISCKYLIDATGRRGQLARHLNVSRAMHDRLVGIGRIGQFSADQSVGSVTQVEACEYGWWYTSPVPGNKILVVLMCDADIVSRRQAARPDRWQSLLKDTKLINERIRGIEFTAKPEAFPSFSSCLKQVGGKDWVAVGDAAASHDPLSATGIPHAIGSGIHGALVAANALFSNGGLLQSYQQSIYTDFQQYLRTHWRYYQREPRWPESTFWKRRRTPISIDPNATIDRAAPTSSDLEQGLVHLPARHSQQLYERCQPGHAAHQIVSAFANDHPQIPDQRIILGLQELVVSGYLKVGW
ncbi:MAG: tryptophan 7-halogenase [Pseudomonadota bacterium]|nr:tryptophan 7-halogenase [Pseudomonadota bacterium]